MKGTLGKGSCSQTFLSSERPCIVSPPLTVFLPFLQAPLTSVARQLSADPDIALSGLEAIDGADVVQTPTGYKVP